jgi:hypothetical protein
MAQKNLQKTGPEAKTLLPALENQSVFLEFISYAQCGIPRFLRVHRPVTNVIFFAGQVVDVQ